MSGTVPDLAAAELSVGLERLVSLLRRLPPGSDLSLTTASTLRLLEQDGPRRLSDGQANQRFPSRERAPAILVLGRP